MMFASFPKAQYQAYRSEIDSAIARVLDSGSYIMGAGLFLVSPWTLGRVRPRLANMSALS